MIYVDKHSFLPLLLAFVMKCFVSMHCSLPHNPIVAHFFHQCACYTYSSGHTSTLHPLLTHHHLCYIDVYCVFNSTFICVSLILFLCLLGLPLTLVKSVTWIFCAIRLVQIFSCSFFCNLLLVTFVTFAYIFYLSAYYLGWSNALDTMLYSLFHLGLTIYLTDTILILHYHKVTNPPYIR